MSDIVGEGGGGGGLGSACTADAPAGFAVFWSRVPRVPLRAASPIFLFFFCFSFIFFPFISFI